MNQIGTEVFRCTERGGEKGGWRGGSGDRGLFGCGDGMVGKGGRGL